MKSSLTHLPDCNTVCCLVHRTVQTCRIHHSSYCSACTLHQHPHNQSHADEYHESWSLLMVTTHLAPLVLIVLTRLITLETTPETRVSSLTMTMYLCTWCWSLQDRCQTPLQHDTRSISSQHTDLPAPHTLLLTVSWSWVIHWYERNLWLLLQTREEMTISRAYQVID